MFKIGTFAIIFNDKREVLLCHRRDFDLWNLPGGKLEEKESPWDGTIRETKEETGLDVRIDKLIGVYNKPDQNEIVFSFLCSVMKGKLILNEEADKIEYFNLDNLPRNTSQKQVERIKDALKNSEKAIFKNQTGLTSLELMKINSKKSKSLRKKSQER